MAGNKVTPGNVFISYRREDTAGYAGRIYDRLNARFPNRVFMDVTGLNPGMDFVDEIEKAVGSCQALIVLIGRNWAVSAEGEKRLENPHDFVRLEVGHALQRGILVVPVLAGGASIPSADGLPAEIGSLLRRQVLKLDDTAFDFYVDQLVKALEKVMGPARSDEHIPRAEKPEDNGPPHRVVYHAPPKKSRTWLWIGIGAFCAVFLVIAVISAVIEEFSTPVDPNAVSAVLSAIQNANAPVSSAQSPGNLPSPSVTPAEPADDREPIRPAIFNPVGRWKISDGSGGSVWLVLQFNRDGSFTSETHGPGFGYVGSQGNWNYDSGSRTLVATGMNNLNAYFQTVFQNLQPDGDMFRAFVPGQGNVVLSRE